MQFASSNLLVARTCVQPSAFEGMCEGTHLLAALRVLLLVPCVVVSSTGVW